MTVQICKKITLISLIWSSTPLSEESFKLFLRFTVLAYASISDDFSVHTSKKLDNDFKYVSNEYLSAFKNVEKIWFLTLIAPSLIV